LELPIRGCIINVKWHDKRIQLTANYPALHFHPVSSGQEAGPIHLFPEGIQIALSQLMR